MENDARRLETLQRNTEILMAMLEHQNLKYSTEEQTPERSHFFLHFTGKDLPITMHLILRADRQVVSVLSVLPFRFREDRRQEAASAVAAANFGLIDGSFDFSPESGEIRFRLTTCFLETELSEALFSYLILVAAETIDRFNDRFFALNAGTLDLAGFLEFDRKLSADDKN